MSEHLGYDKHHPPAGGGDGNIRNGTRAKTVLTEAAGEVPVQVPRDRAGTFEPVVVKKRQCRLSDVDAVAISLYGKGLTTGEISAHFAWGSPRLRGRCTGPACRRTPSPGSPTTSSYGVGITAAVTAAGIGVVEVNRTRPAERRKQGKTDRLDAYRAARSVLSGEATTDPKRASIEPLRALTVARRSAVKAQQAAWRQMGAPLVNAPAGLRDRYRDLPDVKLVATLASSRPDQVNDPGVADTLHALRSLARRHHELGEEITSLEQRMLARATTANPALMAVKGLGPVIGAQMLVTARDNPDRLRTSASFAALCGTAPIPVSSGRTDRHRLSRGGNQANAALHHIVKVRLSYEPASRAYRNNHMAKGWTSKAVFRALKRAMAREVFHALTGQCTTPDYSDLRPARRAKNLTLTTAAAHLGVWPARIGELELGRRPNDELAARYRKWLNAA